MEDRIKTMLIEAGVDWTRTLERFVGNEVLYCKFLVRFPNDPNFLMLDQAVLEKNTENVERAAHTLKGVSANLGLDPIAAILEDMVLSVRMGENDQSQLLVKLHEQYQIFKTIISQIVLK